MTTPAVAEITYINPRALYVEAECGLTSLKLVALARRSGWRTRRIYGRVWIASEDYKAWLKTKEARNEK